MREYPTDEELEFFIQQMEQQELYAPKHMKEQILEKAFPGQTVEVLPKSGSGTGAVRLFTYRLKIAAGMAAALVMLMLLARYPWKRQVWGGQKLGRKGGPAGKGMGDGRTE